MNSDSDFRLNTFSPVAPASPLDALHPHSKYCEYVLSINEIAVAFMRFVLRNSPILPRLRLDKLKVEPGNFLDAQTLKGSEADVVYSIPLEFSNGEQCLVLVSVDRKVKDGKTIYRRISSDRGIRNRFRQVEIGLGGISSLP
ncbi:MAG: Rpn family recombination-promoting nuclease/putative transposase, partial [Thermoguttaceae bacterium]|nr:Rpn family recombination-promoting nuclease/putative transposase [Thermoguttaceae bacterium]